MDAKMVGCQNVEDFNRFLSEIQKIAMDRFVTVRYKSGIWPNIKIKVEDVSRGEVVEDNIELFDTELLMDLILMNIFLDDVKVVTFYEVLRKYFIKWNIPIIPLYTVIDMKQLDIKFSVFVPLNLEEYKDKSINEWRAYAAKDTSIQHRFRSDINTMGIFVDPNEAMNVYVQLLYMIVLKPTMTLYRKDDSSDSENQEILITRYDAMDNSNLVSKTND